MIADAERAIALAGIMGGEETEISDGTSDVLLEAAELRADEALGTSERLRLRTEGSNRWEKGVDPYLAEQAAIWATELIVDLAGAKWVGHTDAKGALPERPVVRFDPEKASAFIGLEVDADEQRDLLARLGLEPRDGGYVVPTWRARDLTREVDLIEEIARFRLDVVPFHAPGATRDEREPDARTTHPTPRRGHTRRARALRGLHPPLVEDDATGRAPAVGADHRGARRPADGAPPVARRDRPAERRGREREVALFEIVRVYLPKEPGELPEERTHVAAIVEGASCG